MLWFEWNCKFNEIVKLCCGVFCVRFFGCSRTITPGDDESVNADATHQQHHQLNHNDDGLCCPFVGHNQKRSHVRCILSLRLSRRIRLYQIIITASRCRSIAFRLRCTHRAHSIRSASLPLRVVTSFTSCRVFSFFFFIPEILRHVYVHVLICASTQSIVFCVYGRPISHSTLFCLHRIIHS